MTLCELESGPRISLARLILCRYPISGECPDTAPGTAFVLGGVAGLSELCFWNELDHLALLTASEHARVPQREAVTSWISDPYTVLDDR